MKKPRIVIDTNVIVSALRSQRGASYKLLMEIGSDKFDINVSVPLVLEYEAAAKRLIGKTRLKSRKKFEKAMSKVADVEPDEYDRL